MDLGKAKLRKVGINNLNSGVHPQHGVIWTDGKSIFLAPIQVEGTHVQNATSVKLGEFEHVTSVHWSRCETGVSACHLCVVHQHNVTVWRVSGALPKLSFKQVRKINVRPIAQGCLWNPSNDVLCLLSRHQCSFYFRHDSNKASFAFPPLSSGKISCGCWTPDGRKLVMCVGSTLLVYRWNDVTAAIEDFTAIAWPIPGLDGHMTSISPVTKDFVVVSAEVPLESLCKQSQDLLTLPDSNQNSISTDGLLRATCNLSATQSLMNLSQTPLINEEGRSTLTLINLQDGSCDPTKVTSAPLRGVLTPDILLYEKSSQCVVVGSNSQSQLHIYALLDRHLAYCGDIQLEGGQRPKGLCSMPTYFDEHGAALLILVGQRVSEDSSFLSAALEADFQLSLKYIILKAGYGQEGRSKRTTSRAKGMRNSLKTRSATGLTKSESMHETSAKNPSLNNHRTPLRHRSGSVKTEVQGRGTPSPSLSEYRGGESPDLKERLSVRNVEKKENSFDRDFLSDVAADVNIVIPDAATRQTLLSGTAPVLSRNNSDRKKIEEISSSKHSVSDHQHSPNLEVETTSFSDHRPSFQNDTLENKFDLCYSPDKSNQVKPPREPKLTSSQPLIQTSQLETKDSNSFSDIKARICEMKKDMEEKKVREYRKSGILRVGPSPLSKSKSLDRQSFLNLGLPNEKSNIELSSSKIESVDDLDGGAVPLISKTNGVKENHTASRDISERNFLISPVKRSNSKCDIPSMLGNEGKQQNLNSEAKTNILSEIQTNNITDVKLSRDFAKIEDRDKDLGDSGLVDRITPRDYASLEVKDYSSSELKDYVTSEVKDYDRSKVKDYSSSEVKGYSSEVKDYTSPEVKDDTGSVLSDRGLGSSLHSSESYFDSIEKQVKTQKDSIEALQKRLADLSVSVDKTSCVFPTRYQEMSRPEMVEVYCEKAEGTQTKRFLLDNGRLQLEPLKLAFGLTTVELWLDGFPCVLGANIDGYIPIKFSPSSRLHITGLPAL